MKARTQLHNATAEEPRTALPLPALLSQVLVAFTIEFDNEFEHRTRHRTARHGGSSHGGPWLASMAMWSTCMRFVGDAGISVRNLELLARTPSNLNGMERWGYIVIQPDPQDPRPKPPRSSWVIQATLQGREAREVWGTLPGVIENRWRDRFGERHVAQLGRALWAVIRQIDFELPECLPILKYGLFSRVVVTRRQTFPNSDDGDAPSLMLSALLSQVLLAFVIEFERQSELSLAIGANILRVLDEEGVRVREIPLRSGVSTEAINTAMGVLRKGSFVVMEPAPTAKREKIVRLTPKGRQAQQAYRRLLAAIEEQWSLRFGRDAIANLRRSLEYFVGDPGAQSSPLFRGLEPYPNGWRASVPRRRTLPHYPMVLHRGGYPDGS